VAEKTLEAVKAFVSQRRATRPDRLQLEMRLQRDLGLDGDEAEEFFTEFFSEFHVDHRTFNFKKHFGSEGFVSWFMFYWFIFLLRESRGEHIQISLNDLVSGVEAKRWLL
jgi:hypothetical protein